MGRQGRQSTPSLEVNAATFQRNLDEMDEAFAAFLKTYPAYETTRGLDELRTT